MEICQHKKNGRIRISEFKYKNKPDEALKKMKDISEDASLLLEPIFVSRDILYEDLNEEQKKEYEAKECWYCK